MEDEGDTEIRVFTLNIGSLARKVVVIYLRKQFLNDLLFP